MSHEIELLLYMAVAVGVFTGAFLMWAFPFAIPTLLKVRQRRIEESHLNVEKARAALNEELRTFKLVKSQLEEAKNEEPDLDPTPESELAINNERQRIAFELHDDTVQRMASVRLRMEEFSYRINKPEQLEVLQALGEEMNQIMKSLRYVINDLAAPAFETDSFSSLMKRLITGLNRVTKTVEFTLENEQLEFGLPPNVKKQLYRLVQEAVQNSMKHAFGFKLQVSVLWSTELKIEIEDSGQGYLSKTGGLGLASMKKRARAIGATLTYQRLQGVLIKITMPNRVSN